MLRVMGAVVDCVEKNALGGELRAHPRHEALVLGFAVQASRDSRLVGYDNDQESICLRRAAKIEYSLQEHDLVGPMHIPEIRVYDPVSVQEQSLAFRDHALSHFGTSCCAAA
jgi:hypothetical protein